MVTQRTFQHLLNFSNCLKEKGYDGLFLSTFGFTDHIQENLIQHVFQCFDEKKNIGPLNLTTYTKWKEEGNPYIRCNFFTGFREPIGFDVMKMHIEYGNQHGVLRTKEMLISNNKEIPTKEEVNKMILEKRKGLKI